MNTITHNPTQEVYAELQKAYDFFNEVLFANKLPPCLITLQRKAKTYGYFSVGRFQHMQTHATTDEISMNPDHFKTESLTKVLSTLVHEMDRKVKPLSKRTPEKIDSATLFTIAETYKKEKDVLLNAMERRTYWLSHGAAFSQLVKLQNMGRDLKEFFEFSRHILASVTDLLALHIQSKSSSTR